MDQNDSHTKQSLTSVLAIIEKVQELRWTLHLAMVVLFADLVLVWRDGRGIIHWSASADQLLANAGLLITGVLAFGVLMSLVMPLFGWVVRWLVWELLINIPLLSSMQTEIDYQHRDGRVYSHELRDHALRKGDKLLLDIYEAHEQKQIAQISDKLAVGQIVFSVLVLATVDYFADGFGIHGTTVLQALVALLGMFSKPALVIGCFLAASALKWAWFSDGPDWIYYPPLYEKIEEERKNRFGIGERGIADRPRF